MNCDPPPGTPTPAPPSKEQTKKFRSPSSPAEVANDVTEATTNTNRRERNKKKRQQPPLSVNAAIDDDRASSDGSMTEQEEESEQCVDTNGVLNSITKFTNAAIKAVRSKQAGKNNRMYNALLSLTTAQLTQNTLMANLEKANITLRSRIFTLENLLKEKELGSKEKAKTIEDLRENSRVLREAAQSASPALPIATAAAPPTTSWATALGRRARPSALSTTTTQHTAAAFPALLPLAPRPGVLFFPTGEGEKRSDTTKELLKKTVSPTTLGVQITSVRNVRNGGIIVHPRSEDEAKRLVKALETSGAGLRAELAGKKQPRVIIFHMPASTTEPQLREAIRTSTQGQSGLADSDYESVRLSHKAGPRTGRCHFVAYVPAAVRAALLADDRLFMGWDSFPVQDFSGVLKCNKCHLYGHMAKSCTAMEPTCSHCAAPGHDRADCTARDGPAKCVACLRHRQPNAHPTNAPECPARQHAELRERAMTDYSVQ